MNARSLGPKLQSLIDCMEEKEAGLCVVTETWFKEGRKLDEDSEWMRETAGLGMISRCRRAQENGVAYGGVSLIWGDSLFSMRRVRMANPEDFEVVVGAGSLRGHTRKVLLVGCYVPLNYDRRWGMKCMEYILDVLIELKRHFCSR